MMISELRRTGNFVLRDNEQKKTMKGITPLREAITTGPHHQYTAMSTKNIVAIVLRIH